MNCNNLTCHWEQEEFTAQQKSIDRMLQDVRKNESPSVPLLLRSFGSQDLCNISDQSVSSVLLAADERAGYWINEDPSLGSVIHWIQSKMAEQS
jgi:hypothetical protein